jgi:DnaJ-class molecular chaperone
MEDVVAFLNKHMSFWDWKSLHKEDLWEEFNGLDSSFHRDKEECDECGGNGISEGGTCSVCDGDGIREMTDEELFVEYCRDEYNAQVQKDRKKYETFIKG